MTELTNMSITELINNREVLLSTIALYQSRYPQLCEQLQDQLILVNQEFVRRGIPLS